MCMKEINKHTGVNIFKISLLQSYGIFRYKFSESGYEIVAVN